MSGLAVSNIPVCAANGPLFEDSAGENRQAGISS